MATMHHDDCLPVIATINALRPLKLCQVLENAESLQTAYARFRLLCTPSATYQLPMEACNFVM